MFAALAISALLQLQGGPRPPEDDERSAFAAQVATLRARWLSGLDTAGWDRDRADARGLADALTAEGVQLRAARPLGSAAEDRLALDALLGDMGGAALMPAVRERPLTHARWVASLLRWSHDGTAIAEVLANAALERDVISAAALWAPPRAVPLVRDALSPERWTIGCHAALLLPEALRRGLDGPIAATIEASRARPPEPACFVAALGLDGARRAAARWLEGMQTLQTAYLGGRLSALAASASAAPVLLAVGLAGGLHDALAQRVLQSATGGDGAARDDVLLRNAIDAAALFAPSLRATPGTQRALRRLAVAADSGGWTVTVARMRWRDPALVDDALAVLTSPGTRDHLAFASLRVVGTMTPDEPDAVRRTTHLLASLAPMVTATEHPTLDEAMLARWSDALAAPPCADARCLLGVFADGTDERAAREVWRLGPRRLASLPADAARALVARVVRRGRVVTEPALTPSGLLWSATSWAVFASVEGCPQGLRGLREAGRGDEGNDPMVAPWRDAFVRACRDADLGSSR